MKKLVFFLLILFILSFFIGIFMAGIYKNIINKSEVEQISKQEILYNNEENNDEDIVETAQSEEKVSYNAQFALKKYYDECGHFKFQYAELPVELVNLTREEIEDLYDDWEVEEFSSDNVVLCQEINSICDEHYLIKLGEKNIEIYNVGNGASLSLYKKTDISKEYLTDEDVSKLQEGIYVFGKGKLNSVLEDFE